jgi:hypothetical protein
VQTYSGDSEPAIFAKLSTKLFDPGDNFGRHPWAIDLVRVESVEREQGYGETLRGGLV